MPRAKAKSKQYKKNDKMIKMETLLKQSLKRTGIIRVRCEKWTVCFEELHKPVVSLGQSLVQDQ